MIPLLLLWAQSLDPGPYSRGMQAAQAEQWEQARREFLEGLRQNPFDKRFPIELAGIDYRTGQFTRARSYLHAALRIDPQDAYANDFLGTLYFLESNYAAAIKYWNRAGKPRLESIQTIPQPALRPVLLDHAIAFAPGEILQLDQYWSTLAWLRGLDALGNFRMELVAKPQEQFDVVIRSNPSRRWLEAAGGLKGVLFQSYHAEFHNLRKEAMTAGVLYRWDAQKRRILAELSAPLGDDPRTRYRIYGDARSETWNIGAADDFRLRKMEAGGTLRMAPSGRFFWELGGRVADRRFAGTTQFGSGFTVVSSAAAGYQLLSLPQRGLTLDANSTWELGRFVSSGGGVYSRAQASLLGHWRRDARSKYEAAARVRFGRIFGPAPYDELFSLGPDKDDAIGMRGHSGTRDGKKGIAPTGGQYVVANLDFFRQVWRSPLGTVEVGPLVDVGRMRHQISGDAPGRTLVDAGLQVRLRLTTGFSFVLSYARSLRAGGVFDAAMR